MMSDYLKRMIYAALVILFVFYTYQVYLITAQKPDNYHEAIRGKMVWQQKNCNACHQIYGLGGFLGPDLTNIYSAPNKGPEYIKAFVQNGTATMPAFQLSEQEMNSLLQFLQSTDASGKSSPKTFKVKWNGTISKN